MAKIDLNGMDLVSQSADDDRAAEYIHGLPEASGTFTGTFDSGADAGLLGLVPDLVPVEIDTHDEPNAAAALLPGQHLFLGLGDGRWSFEVDHVEPLGGNRVRVWCLRPVTIRLSS